MCRVVWTISKRPCSLLHTDWTRGLSLLHGQAYQVYRKRTPRVLGWPSTTACIGMNPCSVRPAHQREAACRPGCSSGVPLRRPFWATSDKIGLCHSSRFTFTPTGVRSGGRWTDGHPSDTGGSPRPATARRENRVFSGVPRVLGHLHRLRRRLPEGGSLGHLAGCIRSDLDCADVCAATAKLAARQTATNTAILRAQLEACAAACWACGDSCEQHRDLHEHCRICMEACRACEARCRELLLALN